MLGHPNDARWALSAAQLNKSFKNDITPEMRPPILAQYKLTDEQRDFLLSAYDIDWLIIRNGQPGLVEDKSIGVQRLRGSRLQLSCGYLSQPRTLQKAYTLGLIAGVNVTFVKWGSQGTHPMKFILAGDQNIDGTREFLTKFYAWGPDPNTMNCTRPYQTAFLPRSGKQIGIEDDFNGLARDFERGVAP